jgi:two-component system phosphate regulon response regulator PhoB
VRLDLRTSSWGDASTTTTTAAPARTTVLVVEDDPVVAGLLRAVLDVEGFGVVTAPDGHAALSLVAADGWAPDIVLLDWMLPHASGLEVLDAIRSRPAWAAVPVVMLTGRSSERDAVRAFAAGADDFVAKPFGPTELVARLRRLSARALV